jgi:Hypoxia induced protein conserved region
MLKEALMRDLLAQFIVPISIGAVTLVLGLGLLNMLRAGSPNTSQKLMRLRVVLQFVAIAVIMLAIWIKSF